MTEKNIFNIDSLQMHPEQKNEARELAKEHWGYIKYILETMYVPTFEHGFKHGVENQKIKNLNKRKK